MRKIKKSTTLLLMSLMVSVATAPQVLAASMPEVEDMAMDAEVAMAQLRMEDKGPDFSRGVLISEVWGTEEDGTPYVERTYVNDITSRNAGTREFTNVKNYGATGSVEVTGVFSFDSVAKTVYVDSCSGQFNEGGGVSSYEDLGTVALNEGSSKASVKYSCRVNKNLGGKSTYSVKVSCNYKGLKS